MPRLEEEKGSRLVDLWEKVTQIEAIAQARALKQIQGRGRSQDNVGGEEENTWGEAASTLGDLISHEKGFDLCSESNGKPVEE